MPSHSRVNVLRCSGWYDPLIQNIAYYAFARYAPGYGQLQPDNVLNNISMALYGPDGCVEQVQDCYAAGNSTKSNPICQMADNYCVRRTFVYCRYLTANQQSNYVSGPAFGNLDPYDLRQNSSALFPPEYYVNYLSLPEVVSAIGAEPVYQECPDAPFELFVKTGDVHGLVVNA